MFYLELMFYKTKYQISMDKTFFLDIFNHLLKIGNKEVFIIFDNKGDIWFGLRDLVKMLEYKNFRKVIQSNIVESKFKKKLKEFKGGALQGYTFEKNLQPNTILINESGLYQLLSQSRKPLAQLFMNKYFTEIMPQIRKTGKYQVSEKEMKKIKELDDKIKKYHEEFKKQEFIPSKNGYFYIAEDNVLLNGKEQKCYKIGHTKNIKSRMKVYKVGHNKHKLLSYIPLTIEGKQLESCVKNHLLLHLKKVKSDTICHISLKKLKDEIIKCSSYLKNHICHCLICQKKYKLNQLDKHKCNNNKIINI